MNFDWLTFLGPAVTAAVVSALVTLISNFRQQSLSYITAERAPWRTRIKNAMQDLLSAFGSPAETALALQRIKSEINPYGINTRKTVPQKWKKHFGYLRRKKAEENDSYYLKDGHIWQSIAEYERELDNHKLLDTLLFKLELMLKYDWERSKKEVRAGNAYLPLSLLCSIASVGFLAAYALPLFKDSLSDIEHIAGMVLLGLILVFIQILSSITIIIDLKLGGVLFICLIWGLSILILFFIFMATNSIFVMYSIYLSLGGFLFSILSSEKSIRWQQRIYIKAVRQYEKEIEQSCFAIHHSPLVGAP